MGLKYVTVLLEGGDSDVRQKFAIDLARRHDARLQGVYMMTPPPPSKIPAAARPSAGFAHTPGVVDGLQQAGVPEGAARSSAPRHDPFEALERQSQAARQSFEHALKAANLNGEFETLSTREPNVWAGLLQENIVCDLLVAGKPVESEEKKSFQRFVTESGIPLLIVPASVRDWSGREVTIGWNGSREALRSVHAALPLIAEARNATVLMVKPRGRAAASAKELIKLLKSHDIECDEKRGAGESMSTSDILVSHAESSRLLVVGAYGRSRMQEMILGGTTRKIVEQATMPLLLAH